MKQGFLLYLFLAQVPKLEENVSFIIRGSESESEREEGEKKGEGDKEEGSDHKTAKTRRINACCAIIRINRQTMEACAGRALNMYLNAFIST